MPSNSHYSGQMAIGIISCGKQFLSFLRNIKGILLGIIISEKPSTARPTLHQHVEIIVDPCAKKKVAWVYAPRIIAVVTHAHVFGDFSIRNEPRHTMSEHSRFVLVSSPDAAIPSERSGTNPRPALIRHSLVRLLPEACNNCWSERLKCFLSCFNLFLHNKCILLCHAPGWLDNAGASCLLP